MGDRKRRDELGGAPHTVPDDQEGEQEEQMVIARDNMLHAETEKLQERRGHWCGCNSVSQGQGKGRPLRLQNVLRHQCASGVSDGDVLPMPACQLRYHGGADTEPRTRRQRKVELHVDCVALIEFDGCMLCGNTLVINADVEHAGCQEVEVWAGRGELCGSHGSIMVRVDRQPRFDVAPGERQVRCQLGRAQTQARQTQSRIVCTSATHQAPQHAENHCGD